MSTSKTQNYNLHAWEPSDDFLRAEINENFAALDAVLGGKGTVVLGSYQGNNTTPRRIELGAPIRFLLLDNTKGHRQHQNTSLTFGAFLLPGFPLADGSAMLDGEALVLPPAMYSKVNDAAYTYLYLAILDKPE